jgi:hypothetical protein
MYRIRSSRTIPLLEAQGGSGRQAGGPTRKGRQEGPSIDTPISKRITNSGAAWHCAEAGHFRQAEHTDPEGRRRRRIDFRPDWVDSARMRGVRGLLRASPSHFGLFSSHYGRVTGKLRMILNCANSPCTHPVEPVGTGTGPSEISNGKRRLRRASSTGTNETDPGRVACFSLEMTAFNRSTVKQP